MQRIAETAKLEGRLDQTVSRLAGCSRSQAAKWVEQGLCAVEGVRRSKAAFWVNPGDRVEIETPDPVEAAVEKEKHSH